MGTESWRSTEESKNMTVHHAYVLVLVLGTSHHTWYCCMFERTHSAARNSTTSHRRARHGTAPHGTAQRCAAELYYIAGLS